MAGKEVTIVLLLEIEQGNSMSYNIIKCSDHPEASSTTRVLSSASYTDARLYTLQIKIGNRTTSAREHSRC